MGRRRGSPAQAQTRARRRSLAAQLSAPARRYLSTEAGSAGLLLEATVTALLWAKSPWSDSYESLWEAEAAVSVAGWELEDVVGYAAQVGLDVEEFLRDLEDEDTAARVRADVASAEASGARGTPTCFVGNARHTGPHDTETLTRALEASRDRAGVPDGR